MALDRVGHQRRGMGALVVQGQAAGVGQGQGVEVVDQAAQHLGLLQQRPQVTLVPGVDAVDLGLDAALQDGQGRAQLVGDVGQEPPSLLLRGGQPGRDVVDGVAQQA